MQFSSHHASRYGSPTTSPRTLSQSSSTRSFPSKASPFLGLLVSVRVSCASVDRLDVLRFDSCPMVGPPPSTLSFSLPSCACVVWCGGNDHVGFVAPHPLCALSSSLLPRFVPVPSFGGVQWGSLGWERSIPNHPRTKPPTETKTKREEKEKERRNSPRGGWGKRMERVRTRVAERAPRRHGADPRAFQAGGRRRAGEEEERRTPPGSSTLPTDVPARHGRGISVRATSVRQTQPNNTKPNQTTW